MEKKTNKGIIAAAAVIGVIVCILIGVLIGLAVINGGGSDELVTDAFCEMVKDSGEKTYYRIPKLNIKKDWAQEVNKRMYTTLYDEYEKGKVLYDGNAPAVSEMGYEWAEKDGIVSITVQLKNAFTGRYEFFVFNIDTQKEREITDEELIEAFGYDKTEYFGMMKDVIRDIYNKEISEMPPTDYIYDSLLEDATKDESLENTLSFITEEGKLNVILPVFSADEKENVETIVDIATGEKQDYFTFDEEYEEIPSEELLSDSEEVSSDNDIDNAERFELADEDLKVLYEMAGYGMADFNSNTSDTAYVINKYITSIFGIGDYGIYFNDGRVVNSYSGNEPKDPRGWFDAYSVLPAENVRWMCENVYNIEFDENYVSDNSYCEGGYVYTYAIIAGDGPMTGRVKHTEKLSDGRYAILLESGYTDYPSEILQIYEEISIIAEIKTTDGKRHWSFYDVKTRKIR